MDYELKDTTGKVSIVDTEVISDDLDDRQFDDDETLATSPEEEANRRDIKNGLYGPEYEGEKF